MRILIAGIILLLAMGAYADSQSELIQIMETVSELNKKPDNDKETTNNTRSVEAKIKAITENSKTEQPIGADPNNALIAKYTSNIADYTQQLVIATIVLGVIGAIQGCLVYRQILLGRQEFIASHRPRIRVQHIDINPFDNGKNLHGEITALNIGDTVANIVSVGVDVFPRDKVMGILPKFDFSPKLLNKPLEIKAGQESNHIFISGNKLTDDAIAAIEDSIIELCLIGKIYYLDRNKTIRITSFFRVYRPSSGRFIKVPENDEYAEYEYEA